jgi:hypothetical protein
MSYEIKYQAQWVDNRNQFWTLDVLTDEVSPPAINTFTVKEGVTIQYELANRTNLYGLCGSNLKFTAYFSPAQLTLLNADIRANGSVLILARLYRNGALFFDGFLLPLAIRRPLDAEQVIPLSMSFAGSWGASKNITVDRLTSVSPVQTVYTWLFQSVFTGATSGIGTIFHDWRPEGQAPSVAIPTGLFGTEFNPDLYADDTVLELNEALAELFQYVYGFSWRLGLNTLMHMERFLEDGVRIEGSTRLAINIKPQLIDRIADDKGEASIQISSPGYGYYRVLADGVELDPPTDDNTRQPQYDRDLRWNLTDHATTGTPAGLSYRDAPTYLIYANATYVDPSTPATAYLLTEASVFVIRETLGKGAPIIFAVAPSDLIDPLFPFWMCFGGTAYLVRARYATLNLSWNRTEALQCLVLAEEPSGYIDVTVAGGVGVVSIDDFWDTGRNYPGDAVRFEVPPGTYTVRATNGALVDTDSVVVTAGNVTAVTLTPV